MSNIVFHVQWLAAFLICDSAAGFSPCIRRFDVPVVFLCHPSASQWSITDRRTGHRRGGSCTCQELAVELPLEKEQPYDAKTYGVEISACCQASDWRRALALFDDMRKASMTPDVKSFNSAISACENEGQWKRALSLFNDMRRASTMSELEDSSGDGASGTLNSVAVQILKLEEEIERLKMQVTAERTGRTTAQRMLREVSLGSSTISGASNDNPMLSLRPIGYIKSSFTHRYGTPRQSQLCTQTRSELHLVKDLGFPTLDGLEDYSHLWVSYIFHQNTNLNREDRVMDTIKEKGKKQNLVRPFSGLVSKVHPPRHADDKFKVGIFACRTTHRPNPLGLSLGRIVKIDKKRRILVLQGLDVLDGSPVVDIKPYLPSIGDCVGDCVQDAKIPDWVRESFETDRIAVTCTKDVQRQLANLIESRKVVLAPYEDKDQLLRALSEPLSMDIRSPLVRERNDASEDIFSSSFKFHGLEIFYELGCREHASVGHTQVASEDAQSIDLVGSASAMASNLEARIVSVKAVTPE